MAPFFREPAELDAKLILLEQRAKQLIPPVREVVEGLANQLLDATEMTGDQVDEFLGARLER